MFCPFFIAVSTSGLSFRYLLSLANFWVGTLRDQLFSARTSQLYLPRMVSLRRLGLTSTVLSFRAFLYVLHVGYDARHTTSGFSSCIILLIGQLLALKTNGQATTKTRLHGKLNIRFV